MYIWYMAGSERWRTLMLHKPQNWLRHWHIMFNMLTAWLYVPATLKKCTMSLSRHVETQGCLLSITPARGWHKSAFSTGRTVRGFCRGCFFSIKTNFAPRTRIILSWAAQRSILLIIFCLSCEHNQCQTSLSPHKRQPRNKGHRDS